MPLLLSVLCCPALLVLCAQLLCLWGRAHRLLEHLLLPMERSCASLSPCGRGAGLARHSQRPSAGLTTGMPRAAVVDIAIEPDTMAILPTGICFF